MKVNFLSLKVQGGLLGSGLSEVINHVFEEGKNASDLHYLVKDGLLCVNYQKGKGRASLSVPLSRVLFMHTNS